MLKCLWWWILCFELSEYKPQYYITRNQVSEQSVSVKCLARWCCDRAWLLLHRKWPCTSEHGVCSTHNLLLAKKKCWDGLNEGHRPHSWDRCVHGVSVQLLERQKYICFPNHWRLALHYVIQLLLLIYYIHLSKKKVTNGFSKTVSVRSIKIALKKAILYNTINRNACPLMYNKVTTSEKTQKNGQRNRTLTS